MDLKKAVSILKGSYTLTTEDGKTSGTYKLPKGKGFVVLNLGIVKLGKECIKYDIEKLVKPLEKGKMTMEELKKVIDVLKKRCKLLCTTDPATNTMTYDEWLDYILGIINKEKT